MAGLAGGHVQDPRLNVCPVCPTPVLGRGGSPEPEPLDKAFLDGIREELGSVEESEKNIQAISQVFRYYSRHARQLGQVLMDWARQCFPWELTHALHLIDDILLMDNSGRYKAVLADRMQVVVVNAFKKVPSDREKREVARMLQTWQELRVFGAAPLETIRAAIRSSGAAAQKLLEEGAALDEEDDPGVPAAPRANGTAAAAESEAPQSKRPRAPAAAQPLAPAAAAAVQPAAAERRRPVNSASLEVIERILQVPVERPFELLGLPDTGVEPHDIRKAYRRLALLIHPDKNPGDEVRCQEALVRLQEAREQAEGNPQRVDDSGPAVDATKGETRSAATAAAAASTLDGALKCRFPGCNLPPCKQCANGCCSRNITHCHTMARLNKGMQCYFHPPPRAWARNA